MVWGLWVPARSPAAGLLMNPRGQSLVDASYRSMGYRTDKPGVWIR